MSTKDVKCHNLECKLLILTLELITNYHKMKLESYQESTKIHKYLNFQMDQ